MNRESKPVGPQRAVEILRGLTSLSDRDRLAWADTPGYWRLYDEFDYHECRTLTAVMAYCALVETGAVDGNTIRDGYLDSLDVFAQGELVPIDVIEQVVSAIPPGQRDRSETEYFETFEQMLARRVSYPDHRDIPARLADRRAQPPGGSVGPARAIALVRGLVSAEASHRDAWSTVPRVWSDDGRFDDREAATVASVLGWAIQVETDRRVRAAFLVSLATLARRDLAPVRALADALGAVDEHDLDPPAADAHRLLARALAPAPRQG